MSWLWRVVALPLPGWLWADVLRWRVAPAQFTWEDAEEWAAGWDGGGDDWDGGDDGGGKPMLFDIPVRRRARRVASFWSVIAARPPPVVQAPRDRRRTGS
ncbi:MAG: hypothetical protein C4547_12825 [Phycisphaerales bacterium]|nr:MAG: hypothetical protein C4547_12825 [Phycisphaerales bacterium]